MIEINAKKVYDENVALDVSFTLEEGKKYALIGANGSGKSTLIKILAGIIDFEGRIENPIKDIVYMPQTSYAFALSVRTNILLAFPFKDKNKHSAEVGEIIEKMGLAELKNKNAGRLSGGETQKVALARVLIKKHDMLLLDEPTSAMDIESALRIEKTMMEYAKTNNTTLVYATHSLRQASLADEIIFMKDGKIVERGDSKTMLKNPQNAATKQFIDFFR